MAATLMDTVMNSMGPQVMGPLASHLGVTTDMVQRGLQTSSAAILSGLASKADEPGFLGQIFGMVTNPANTQGAISSLTSNIGSAISGASPSSLMDMGSRFLSNVFGSRLSSVTDSIGQFAGMGANKASMLMSMAGPLVLGSLGQHVRENNLSASGLASELRTESTGLQRFLPTGLTSMFSSAAGMAGRVPGQAAGAANRWLWPVVILAALILSALWFFNRARQPAREAINSTANAVQNATNAVTNTAAGAAATLGDFFRTTLPNGTPLNIPQNGIENRLIGFIGDRTRPVDETTWFNFDRLMFDPGQATLAPGSQEQLNNIAEIMKAYPNVHVAIAGYTDNTGDTTANLALSAARAKNVMLSLVDRGIDQSRLSAQGFGDQNPIADNSTEAGREQNRRIALRVTQK